MLSNEIRESFFEFYRQSGHVKIPSASLVPVADPTLLLINSGMAPLKRYFMGQDEPPAQRCVNTQKCVRTIDIDQVGRTNRHNTFFEMLGKWSFGDYFKIEAMRFTMEWFTSKAHLGLNTDRLYITHHEKDDETRRLWASEMGWPESRLFGLGDKDNLWAAGDVGPWGYDTEYFWDLAPDGQSVDRARFIELCDIGRIVEIGNDVFMQFTRDEDGNVSELPKKNVDFGGGLERMCMVLQDKATAYETDAFDYLIRGFAEVIAAETRHTPDEHALFGMSGGINPYFVAADHIRASTFLLSDGVTPGNTGRNYVLRRLIRRIVAQAYRLGVRRPFIMRLADLVIGKLGTQYIELRQNRASFIEPWISKEEEQFFKVMETGYGRLAEKIEHSIEARAPIAGEFLFELYDTYGFPFDIAREICSEAGVEVMEDAFERAMAEQRTRARGSAKFEGSMGEQELHTAGVEFLGYFETSAEVTVTDVEELADIRGMAALIAPEDPKSGPAVPGLRVTTDSTPFYSDSGGQPSDTGWLPLDGMNFPMQSAHTRGVHIVREVNGELPELEAGSRVIVAVNVERRNALRRPHTTNHLMLQALKEVLGEHVNQQGSQLGEDEIRFDFSHFQAMTADELRRVEDKVNRWILEDYPVGWIEMPLVTAKSMGVTAVFDEKYGNTVRVVSVGMGEHDSMEGWVSRELCGGIHLDHTSQAGAFAIVREESVSSGVRRLYAVTGFRAISFMNALRSAAGMLGGHFKYPLPSPAGHTDLRLYETQAAQWSEEIRARISETETKYREAHQSAIEARREMALAGMQQQIEAGVSAIGGMQVLAVALELSDRADAKYIVERYAGQLWKDNYAVFVAGNVNGQAALACKVSAEAIARGVNAAELIKLAAGICGGGGGGRPDYAEAGGKDGSKVGEAVAAVLQQIQGKLS